MASAMRGCADDSTSTAEARERFVLSNLGYSTVSLSYRAATGETRPVRDFYVELHVSPQLREPMAFYSDGSPVGSHQQVTADTMRAVVETLARAGFFRKAARLHSEWVAQPSSQPPADSQRYGTARHATTLPAGALVVRIVVPANEWHHYFEHAYPLDSSTRGLLERIGGRVPSDVRSELESGLIAKMR